MDFRKTDCFKIRYGPIADVILEGGNVLWSYCQPGVPGTARVFAQLPNGKYVYLTWTYGISPDMPDLWFKRGLSDIEIELEMRQQALHYQSKQQARNFLLETIDPTQLSQFDKLFRTMRKQVLPLLRPSKPYGVINSNGILRR